MSVSLYIHIPFCTQKCSYCDFTGGFPAKPESLDLYTTALTHELRLLSSRYPDKRDLATLYFGGGTPSLLDTKHLDLIFKIIRGNFNLNSKETTLEANPEDVTPEKAFQWKSLGIDRISLGFQSMEKSSLRFLGRRNTPETNIKSFDTLREAGFKNISVDWISCIGNEDVDLTLRALLTLSPEHISVYQLTVAEKTMLYQKYRRKEYIPPDPETAMQQYWRISDALKAAGYSHYEISNFSRSAEYRSRHNTAYWNYDEYLAAGLGASAYLRPLEYQPDGIRRTNTVSWKGYLAALNNNLLPPAEVEQIDSATAIREYLMVGLRKLDGIPYAHFKSIFGREFFRVLNKTKLQGLSEYIIIDDAGIRLTREGIGVSNRVISMLWDALEQPPRSCIPGLESSAKTLPF